MLRKVVLVSRRKLADHYRVLVQLDESFDPGQWDAVISLHNLKIWTKSSQSWRGADEGSLITALTEAARWQDDKLHGLLELFATKSKSLKTCTREALRPLLSSSLLAERSNVHKSPYLDQVIQVLWAATEIRKMAKSAGGSPEVRTTHRCTAEQMVDMGLDTFFDVQWIGPSKQSNKRNGSISRFLLWSAFAFRSTVILVKGLIWLWARFFSRLQLKSSSSASLPTTADVLFLDYFFDRSHRADGQSKSKYWGTMPDSVETSREKVSFAHIFVPHGNIRTMRKARKFNKENGVESVFIEEYVEFTDHVRAMSVMVQIHGAWIADFMWQGACERHSTKVEILRNWEVAVSLFGTVGASHLLYEYAFQRLAEESSNSGIRKLVYVCEFQGWETRLLENFRAYGIETIGYCHSTLRLLDARGYLPASTGKGAVSAVRPDVLAVHSKMDASRLRFRAGQARVELVESTRYKQMTPKNGRHSRKSSKKVLVVGGYSPAETAYLVQTCQKALEVGPEHFSLAFLSHPNQSVSPTNFPSLKRDSSTSFSDLLSDFEVAVVAPETSGAMEALVLGLKVIIVVKAGKLVASPVYGLAGVEIVSEAEDLIQCLNKVAEPAPARLDRLRPLTHDKRGFTLWSDLLKGQ